jgi:hypothetical protein
MMLVFGGADDKARATKIAADLDSIKQAALSYESQHRTRNNDPFEGLVDNESAFTNAVNRILENPLPADRRATLTRNSDNRLVVAFEDFEADSRLAGALNNFVGQHRDAGYDGKASGGDYTLTLLLK